MPYPDHGSPTRIHAMTTPARFELYSFWRTSATYRVRVALNLKGVQAQEHNVNLDTGEQRSEAFLKINPLGAIPALLDNEAGASAVPITQSLAILEFLDETYPSPALLPTDTHGRARVRSLAAMLVADTHPLITPRVKKVPRYHRRLRRRGLARLADSMVHDRPAGLRAAARERARHRHLLPRRIGDAGRHLPGQHHRRDACVQDRGGEHPDHRPHHGHLRGQRGLREGRAVTPARRASGLKPRPQIDQPRPLFGLIRYFTPVARWP